MAADCSCGSLGPAHEHSLIVTNRDAPIRKTVRGNPPEFRMEIGVMMHKLDRRAFCVAMGLIGLGVGSIDVRAEDGAIRLGIVAPMSGPNSRYGSFSLRGAQLAVEEINNAGGLGGRLRFLRTFLPAGVMDTGIRRDFRLDAPTVASSGAKQ